MSAACPTFLTIRAGSQRLRRLVFAAALAASAFASASPLPLPASVGLHWILDNGSPELSRAEAFSAGSRSGLAPSEELSAALASHIALPSAHIATVISEQSSHTFIDPESGKCLVLLSFPQPGVSSIFRSMLDMSSSAGAQPSLDMDFSERASAPSSLSILRSEIMEFEALHELGHCALSFQKNAFAHPALSPRQNSAIAFALGSSTISSMRAELFSDAYAALMFLRARRSASEQTRAFSTLRLIRSWRAANIHAHFGQDASADERASLALPSFSHHATAPVLSEILLRPDAYLAMDPVQASLALSSRAAIQTAQRSADPESSWLSASSPRSRLTLLLTRLLPDLWEQARHIESGGDSSRKDALANRLSIELMSRGAFERAFLVHRDLVAEIALREMPPWALENPESLHRQLSPQELLSADIDRVSALIASTIFKLPETSDSLSRAGYTAERLSLATQSWRIAVAFEARERLRDSAACSEAHSTSACGFLWPHESFATFDAMLRAF